MLIAKGRRDPQSKGQKSDTGSVQRSEVSSVDDMVRALSRGTKRHNASARGLSAAPAVAVSEGLQSLFEIMTIKVGIVTGDSSYFLLTEERRRELGLPLASVVPVLSRAKHLTAPEMTAVQWKRLKAGGEKVWLFNPSAKIAADASVRSYLRFGRAGGCKIDNQKVMIRRPWFRFPGLAASDGYMSGMSSQMPWLCFRSTPNLLATNTLYVVNFADRFLTQRQRTGVAMSLLTSGVRDQMKERGRLYADGLLKFEPSDLLGLQVPKVGNVVAEWQTYRQALRALKEGDEARCCKIADGCLV